MLLCVVIVAGSLALGGNRADAGVCYPTGTQYFVCVGPGSTPTGEETEVTVRDFQNSWHVVAGVIISCEELLGGSERAVYIYSPLGAPVSIPLGATEVGCIP